MSNSTVAIIGAGLGGCTLARSLKVHGIPAVVYDKAPPSRRYNYAITLQPRCISPLARLVGMSVPGFLGRVGVDQIVPASGPLAEAAASSSSPSSSPPFPRAWDRQGARVHRQKLEDCLRESLDVRWEAEVEHIDLRSYAEGPVLSFRNGDAAAQHGRVVCADGVHSAGRRCLMPDHRAPAVLPYVAIHGKRRLTRETFQRLYSPAFGESSEIATQTKGGALLQLDVFQQTQGQVSIGWVYSRNRRGPHDRLFTPGRANSEATDIPEEFYGEVASLRPSLQQPFHDVLDPERLRRERLLSWLMRTTAVPLAELRALAERQVYLIGDAAHAEPILGGSGGSNAIADALGLAECMAGRRQEDAAGWYDGRYGEWTESAEKSRARISEMHPEPGAQQRL